MYGVFTYIYHKNQLDVGEYTIHGSYGEQFKPPKPCAGCQGWQTSATVVVLQGPYHGRWVPRSLGEFENMDIWWETWKLKRSNWMLIKDIYIYIHTKKNIYMLYIYRYTYTRIYCILNYSIISWSCFLQSSPSNMFRKGYPQELVPPPSQGANGKSGPSIQAKTCWKYPMKIYESIKIF